jgi:ubiquinone/menaquinone biosynthesis C-methylase UbiE
MVKNRNFAWIPICLFLFTSASICTAQVRDTWQQPEKVMDAIGVTAGMTVGEVGAGEGYFTFKLAGRVGKEGKVYANDIDRSSLRHIEESSRREGIDQVTTIVGDVEDPLFPAGAMDLVIMVYVLHDLTKPVELLRNIQPALKPGAPLVILERDPEKSGDRSGHFYGREKLLEIVGEAGFELVRVETFLSRDNVYIFKLSDREEDCEA